MSGFILRAPKSETKSEGGYVLRAPKNDELKLAGDGGFQGSTLGGVVQGARDVLDAGAQMLSHALPEGVRNTINRIGGLPEGIDKKIQDDEAAYQQARAASGRDGIDLARITGGIAATLPLASVKALQLAKGKSAFDAANLARAAAQGGIVGAAQPVTKGNFADEKLGQIGTGAAFGAAMAPIGSAIGSIISPNTSKEVKSLMAQGITPTPGQILGGVAQRTEDKLMSVPLLGDAITGGRKRAVEELNRAAYARALVGTGVDAKSLPVGREGIEAVKNAVSKQYDDLLPKLVFKPDSQFVGEINNLQQMASKGLGGKELSKFESLMGDINPNRVMTGDTYKLVEAKLAHEAKNFSSSADPYHRELGSAINETLSSMKAGLTRSNPSHAKELAQANSNYANYVRLRNAGSRAGDQSQGFSPSQLAAAVRGSDRSVGKGKVATGNALMQDLSDAGVNVLNSKYPDSGTIGRGLAAGALGGAATINPMFLGVGAAALPYTKSGQKIMAALLARRPAGANALSHGAKKLAPLVGTALGQSLLK